MTKAELLEPWDYFVIGTWNPWPITLRTRFMVWRSMGGLTSSMDMALAEWDPEDDGVGPKSAMLEDFPPFAATMPEKWWRAVLKSAQRLTEAFRTGEMMNPRTPAEEAILFLACEHVGAVKDELDHRPELVAQFDALPVCGPDDGEVVVDEDAGPDFDYDEVLAALAGDTDVEMMWDMSVDGVGDPSDEANVELGIGDYRPQSWNRMFDRFVRAPEMRTSLF